MSATVQGEWLVSELEIVNELGLHARAAAKLVETASRFTSDVELTKDGHDTNAKSIMGLLLLCGAQGTRIGLRARGADAQAAIDAIKTLVADKFGEGR